MEMFDITLNDNRITIAFNKLDDIYELLRKYQPTLHSEKSNHCTLNIDMKSLPILAKSKLKNYDQFFALCSNSDFEKINIFTSNAISSSQVEKIAQKNGIGNFDVFNLNLDCDS